MRGLCCGVTARRTRHFTDRFHSADRCKVTMSKDPGCRSTRSSRSSKPVVLAETESYGPEVLKRRVKVWWAGDKKWFSGIVKQFSAEGKHLVAYDDGDIKWHNLGNEEVHEQLKWVDLPSSPPKRKRKIHDEAKHEAPRQPAARTSRPKAASPKFAKRAASTPECDIATADNGDDDENGDADEVDDASEFAVANFPCLFAGATASSGAPSGGRAPSSTLHALMSEALSHLRETRPASRGGHTGSSSAEAADEGVAVHEHANGRVARLAAAMRREGWALPEEAVRELRHAIVHEHADVLQESHALAGLRAATADAVAAAPHGDIEDAFLPPLASLAMLPTLARLLRSAEEMHRLGRPTPRWLVTLLRMVAAAARPANASTESHRSTESRSTSAAGGAAPAAADDVTTIAGALASDLPAARAAAAGMVDVLLAAGAGDAMTDAMTDAVAAMYRAAPAAAQSRVIAAASALPNSSSELALLVRLYDAMAVTGAVSDGPRQQPPRAAWLTIGLPEVAARLRPPPAGTSAARAAALLRVQCGLARAAMAVWPGTGAGGGAMRGAGVADDAAGRAAVATACRALAPLCARRLGEGSDVGLTLAANVFACAAASPVA